MSKTQISALYNVTVQNNVKFSFFTFVLLLCEYVFFFTIHAGLGALYGPLIPYKLSASVHCMIVNAFKKTTNLKPLDAVL